MKLSEMEVHIKQIEREKQEAIDRMVSKNRWSKKHQEKKKQQEGDKDE
tara:strand:+ start:1147 stop:1290 length:144 start_codon:yes stop_codon:yes gene_type:complete